MRAMCMHSHTLTITSFNEIAHVAPLVSFGWQSRILKPRKLILQAYLDFSQNLAPPKLPATRYVGVAQKVKHTKSLPVYNEKFTKISKVHSIE